MVDFADVGGVVFAGAYLITAPIVLADGPQPGPVDAMWLFGLSRAYNTGRRMGGYLDNTLDIYSDLQSKEKPKKSIEELKLTPTQNKLTKPQPLELQNLPSGSWIVNQYAKKKKRTSRGLYA